MAKLCIKALLKLYVFILFIKVVREIYSYDC